MALQPSASLGIGLATAGLVIAIHNQATPSQADIRVAMPNDEHIAASERAASWLSVAAVAGISLLTKDPTIFILGGATVVALAWWQRYGNAINPMTGSVVEGGNVQRLDLASAPDVDDSDLSDASGF